MEELSPAWHSYARLQRDLALRTHVDHKAWGLEASLHRILAQGDGVHSDEAVDRVVRSQARKERYRAGLRRIYLTPRNDEATHDAMAPNRQLWRLRELVSLDDWKILSALAEGFSYDEIAEQRDASPGSLRVRVMRLRRNLRDGVRHDQETRMAS